MMQVFRAAVERSFQPLSDELGADWQEVCPWIYGFTSRSVQVTAGVYHGHIPSIVVKLRPNIEPAPLGTDDKYMFGLGWLEAFVTGNEPPESETKRWTLDNIVPAVERLASQFRRLAMPLLMNPNTDWTVIHSFVRKQIAAQLQ